MNIMRTVSHEPSQAGPAELSRLKTQIDDLKRDNHRLRKRLADLGGAHLFRDRYAGDAATGYDEKRSGTKMWRKENDAVERYLGGLGEGRTVLDAPVGTGRFIPLYGRFKSKVTGVDSSPDMLAEARRKAESVGQEIELTRGDVMTLDYAAGQFDVVLCVRLLNFFRADELKIVVGNIARFARRNVILTLRTHDGSEPLHSGEKFTIVHPARAAETLFEKNGLKVLDRTLVSASEVGDNHLMLLAKQ